MVEAFATTYMKRNKKRKLKKKLGMRRPRPSKNLTTKVWSQSLKNSIRSQTRAPSIKTS